MKEFFKMHRFSPDSKRTVQKCVKIVKGFQEQGLKLTLRQLFYQLVTVNEIANSEKQYKRLSGVLSDARLMGMIDWSAIEDRIRLPRVPQEFGDLEDLVDAAIGAYRLPRWEGQGNYVECWVEKDAIAGILAPIAREYHVTMMVNRGYSSQSAMYDSAKRFITACYGKSVRYKTLEEVIRKPGDKASPALADIKILDRDALPHEPARKPILLYLGDHDPSGEDMLRDIEERLGMFGIDVDVRKIALTIDQVHEYDPPPNPAKMKDPRASEYVDKHGAMSWEVDALPPDVLDRLVRESIESVVDIGKMDKIKRQEERDKAQLTKAVESVRKKK